MAAVEFKSDATLITLIAAIGKIAQGRAGPVPLTFTLDGHVYTIAVEVKSIDGVPLVRGH